jgi:hypothetical protein
MFTFGSDPEFSLEQNNKNLSAIPFLNDKTDKKWIEGHAFYYDNVLAECSIKPANSRDEAVANVKEALAILRKLVDPCLVRCEAAIYYERDQLLHPQALEIACDPEYCCYTLEEYRPDVDEFKNSRLRTAGGHIHVGHPFPKTSLMECFRLTRMFDLFVGIPCLFIDKDPTSQSRKKFYGQAGRFRKPEHGFEYRSLSNFWLASPKLVELVYDLTAFTLDFTVAGKDQELWNIDLINLRDDKNWARDGFHPSEYHYCTGYDKNELIRTLGSNDLQSARKFMDIIKHYMPEELFNKINEKYNWTPDLKNWDI